MASQKSDESPHRLKNSSATNTSVKEKRPANADNAMTVSGPAIKGQERDLNPAASQYKTSTKFYSVAQHTDLARMQNAVRTSLCRSERSFNRFGLAARFQVISATKATAWLASSVFSCTQGAGATQETTFVEGENTALTKLYVHMSPGLEF